MHTVKFLVNLIEHHQVLAYAVIFLGLVFEGEVVLISTGVLAHLGAVNFYFALAFVLCGGAVKTVLGYYVGVFIHKKWRDTKFIKYLEHKVGDIMPNFSKKPFWSIFISKFIISANHIVIIFSGYKKVKKKIFFKAEFLSTIIWAPVLLSLGYYFSYTALGVSKEVWTFSLIVVGLVILFITIDKFLAFAYKMFEEFYDNVE